MNRLWIKSVFVVLVVFLIVLSVIKLGNWTEEKTQTNNKKQVVGYRQTVTVNVLGNADRFFKEIKISEDKERNQEEARPNYSNVPLNEDTLNYIYGQSKKYNIGYSYVLAIIATESEYYAEEQSPTHDTGLMQVNTRTAKWIAEQLGMKSFNMKDEKQNILFGTYYLNYLREYWKTKYEGISDEELFNLTTVSYNRGAFGTIEYTKYHNIEDNGYLRAVLKNKAKIEKGDV